MNRKLFVTLFAALSALALAAAPEFSIKTDRETQRYQCGEEAVFTVSATENGQPVKQGKMKLKMTLDGGKVLQEAPIDFSKANPATVKITLKEPGFVRAQGVGYVDIETPKKPLTAGAAFDPDKIQLGFDLPDDFMEFWESGRKQLAGDTIKLTKLDKFSTDKYTSYRVVVDTLYGEKLYGFLAVPTGRGPFPAYLSVPGAGPGAAGPITNYAEKGVITLVMNVHKFEGAMNAAELRKQYAAQQKQFYYPQKNADDRDKYHFRNVILGVDRAINYVAAMPEWDRKHFAYYGSSQGGGMGLILAGFNKNITAAAVNVPALCDHGGYKFDRQPGWPQLVRKDAKREAVAPYYDAGNFARFITVPILASAGYIDSTCSPSSVYAAFNQIKAPKKLIDMPLAKHEIPKIFTSYQLPWIDGQLGLGKEMEPTAK